MAETLESKLRADLHTVEGNLGADLYDVIRARTDGEWERVAVFAASLHENAVRADLLQNALRWVEETERAAAAGRAAIGMAA